MEQQYHETHQEPPQEDLQAGFNSNETTVVVVGNNTHHHSASTTATSPISDTRAQHPPRPPHTTPFLNRISPPLLTARTSGNPIRRTLSGGSYYNVVPLPIAGNIPTGPNPTSPLRSYSTLRRCCNTPPANPLPPPGNPNPAIPTQLSVPNSRSESSIPSPLMNSPTQTTPNYYPRHHLIRSVSDPCPLLENSPQETTPWNPTSAITCQRNYSVSPTPAGTSCFVNDDSPASKRLKTVGERMREMRQRFDEIIQEHETTSAAIGSSEQAEEYSTEITVSGQHATAGYQTNEIEVKENEEADLALGGDREEGSEGMINEGGEVGIAGRFEEEGGDVEEEEDLVIAEKVGDRIHLKFKCRCGGSGYDVILDGQNCYYKLL